MNRQFELHINDISIQTASNITGAGEERHESHFCFECLDSAVVILNALLPLPRRQHGAGGAIECDFELGFSDVPVAAA